MHEHIKFYSSDKRVYQMHKCKYKYP